MRLINLELNKDHPMYKIAQNDTIDRVLQVIDQIDEGLISHTDELREAIEELRQ